jgi:hypothetical protein
VTGTIDELCTETEKRAGAAVRLVTIIKPGTLMDRA